MKCQHCGSTDIVAIQGQNFCLNCGYKVVEAPATPRVLNPPKPKERRKTKPKTKPKTRTKSKIKEEPAPAVVMNAPAAASTAPIPRSNGHRAVSSDVQRRRVAGAQVHPLRFSLMASAILGVLVGGVAALTLVFRLDQDINLFLVLGTLIVAFNISLLSQSALIYGVSRSEDRRPATRDYWWAAARGSHMDLLNVMLLTLICVIVLLGSGIALQRPIGQLAAGNIVIASLALGVLNLILGWCLIGVYVARRIAGPAIVVGSLTAWQGLRTGWKLYLKYGGHLIAAVAEVLLGKLAGLLLIMAAIYIAAIKLEGQNLVITSVGTGLVIALAVGIGVFISLELESRIWLKQYRRLVTLLNPTERLRLLTGRVSARNTP